MAFWGLAFQGEEARILEGSKNGDSGKKHVRICEGKL